MSERETSRRSSLYEEGATFVGGDRSVHTGWASIREILAALAEQRPQINMNIFKVVQVGDDLAVLYNDWTVRRKTPEGNPAETTNKAIELVRRQPDGSWRSIYDDPFARKQ
jgi:uncharacterized protein (TIGR02246 family)